MDIWYNFHITFKQALNYKIIYDITFADRNAKVFFLVYGYINFLGKKFGKSKYQHWEMW
jgi:hypothetical protein